MTIRTLFVVALVTLAACSSRRRIEEPLPSRDPTRISHEQHAQIPCGNCHRAEGTRPGADDHKPCDDGACHKKEFLQPPGAFCQVCHFEVTAQPLVAKLRPYPRDDDAWRSIPSRFSHALHLDNDRMESRVGFHVACADCHTGSGDQLRRPDHGTCARCHAAEAATEKAPKMAKCDGCHEPGSHVRVRKRLIRGDLEFHHERHRLDRKGNAIGCPTCHAATKDAKGYADHAPPKIERCVGCHDDRERAPYEMRMRICETCHTERQHTLTTIAPRNHLPTTERPIDHTLAFRRDHAEVAARDATRCAGCHVQMSGNPRQACDECHRTMLPADHRITFRELDHGPEAAANRSRCATCHVVDFCSACHKQRPRSHGQFGTFRIEHGRLARLNVRACLTCHSVGDGGAQMLDGPVLCSAAGCHDGGMP